MSKSYSVAIAGATGALCVILALKTGGTPLYVAPLVFAGAPIVNAFVAFPALLLLLASAAFAQPSFDKTFSPSTITAGDPSKLIFTIDNSANSVASTDLAVTLPGSLASTIASSRD